MSMKRSYDEIAQEEQQEESSIVLRTCSHCSPFCASWSGCTLVKGGVKYMGGAHAHRIWDSYHQWYSSESEDDSDDEGSPKIKQEPTVIGRGKDECTTEERVSLVTSLYKIADTNQDLGLFADPEFLERCFKDLVCDQNKTIRFAVLYSCNKIEPEIHSLPRDHGVAEIEKWAGKLEVFTGYDYQNDESDDEFSSSCPYEVSEIDDADEAEHFVLTKRQWEKLRLDEHHHGCPTYMSVFTYYNEDSINVKDIFGAIQII